MKSQNNASLIKCHKCGKLVNKYSLNSHFISEHKITYLEYLNSIKNEYLQCSTCRNILPISEFDFNIKTNKYNLNCKSCKAALNDKMLKTRNKTSIICPYCNNEFYYTKSAMIKHYRECHNITPEEHYRNVYGQDKGYCLVCGKPTRFISFNEGFKKYCSNICSEKDYNKRKQTKQTCLQKYGVENVAQSYSVKSKKINTCLQKYGVENVSQSTLYKIKNLKQKYNIQKELLMLRRNISIEESYNEYINNFNEHKYYCNIHNIHFTSNEVYWQYVHCPECKKEYINNRTSIGEKSLLSFLSLYTTCNTNNRTILNNKEIDIVLPEYKIGIEYDGVFWHSSYKIKDSNYHLNKTKKANESGYKLFHIFDIEWENSQDIVKSILLSKLGIFNRRIFARKCVVRELNNDEYRLFTEQNHLQGYNPAKYKLGLYYKNELVEICSFGKSRYKSDEYELIRHCSLLNTQVIGGLSKLVVNAIRMYKFNRLITYCDKRFSIGEGYINSGWTYIHDTHPNYFYIVNGKLESRLNYQKHKLKKYPEYDESLTETEIMDKMGYYRIYDCGSIKFEYKQIH